METFQGIILRQVAYKESSKILHIYTSEGLISVLVHGAKRLKSPYLAMMDRYGEVSVFTSGKNLRTLHDASLIHHFDGLKHDFLKSCLAEHLAELVLHIADAQIEHHKLAPFLSKVFFKMEQENNALLYVMMFELKLLYLLGIQPSLKQCVICNQTSNLQFSIEDGGMRCREHLEHIEHWSDESIRIIRLLYYFDIQDVWTEDMKEETLREIRRFIDLYYEVHLQFTTKSRKLLMGLLGY